MKKFMLFSLVYFFVCGAFAQVYMYFQDPSNLPFELQDSITTTFNEKCADAYTYRWTIAEVKTDVSSDSISPMIQSVKFNSRFMSITAFKFEFSVLSEGQYNPDSDVWTYQVNSLTGTCN